MPFARLAVKLVGTTTNVLASGKILSDQLFADAHKLSPLLLSNDLITTSLYAALFGVTPSSSK